MTAKVHKHLLVAKELKSSVNWVPCVHLVMVKFYSAGKWVLLSLHFCVLTSVVWEVIDWVRRVMYVISLGIIAALVCSLAKRVMRTVRWLTRDIDDPISQRRKAWSSISKKRDQSPFLQQLYSLCLWLLIILTRLWAIPSWGILASTEAARVNGSIFLQQAAQTPGR